MSPFFTWQHAIIKSQLEPTTRLVCLTIGCHMAADGSGCFPSYQTIANETGLSRRAVIQHVGLAAQAGYLDVDARQRENGSASSNIYRPTMPRGGEPAALGGEPRSPGGSEPAAPPITDHSFNIPINSLSQRECAKPTKASPSANPRIRLEQFLEDAPGTPAEWLVWAVGEFGWNEERVNFELDDFRDYWTSGNAAGGGLKSDWPATWRSHCRRVSGVKGRGPRPAGGTPGQGGGQRYDPVAAGMRRAMAELFGDGAEGSGRPPVEADFDACPFPDREEAGGSMPVDARPGDEASLLPAPAPDGGGSGGDVRVAVPIEVE